MHLLAADLKKILFDTPNATAVQVAGCLNRAKKLSNGAAVTFVTDSLGLIRDLYTADRARDALPIAEALAHIATGQCDAALQIRALLALGNVAMDSGALVDAMQALNRARQITDRNNPVMADIIGNVGLVRQYAGDFSGAIACQFQTLEILSAAGADDRSSVKFNALSNIAYNCAATAQHERGLNAVAQCAALALIDPQPALSMVLLHRHHIRLLVQTRQLDVARSTLAALREAAVEANTPRADVSLLLSEGLVAMLAGNYAKSQDALAQALDLARDSTYNIADVLIAVGQCAYMVGDVAAAEMHYNEVARLSAQRVAALRSTATASIELSNREWEMLETMYWTAKMVAEKTGTTEAAVRKARSRIYLRIGVTTKEEAVEWVRKHSRGDAILMNGEASQFAKMAVATSLGEALGWQTSYLTEAEKALVAQPELTLPAVVIGCPAADMRWPIVGFNQAKAKRDVDSATHFAAAFYDGVMLRREVSLA